MNQRSSLLRQKASTAIDIDRIAKAIDPAKMGPRGLAQLLETLHLLRAADSEIALTDVRTGTLVGLLVRATDDQLAEVAASAAARELVLAEVFRRMAEHLRPEKTANLRAVIRWRIDCGRAEPELLRYQTVITAGQCRTGTELDEPPRVTLTLRLADFLRLATGGLGRLGLARLVAARRLSLRGDLRFAARLPGLFAVPTP